ncbi:integron integrase [Limnoglobus roseus]|uniref:Integron integrase n=1 Tax=Limnoglobus roseus TaxID=2598579 RepID=A0A5C1ACH3_9BACT|nr:integron integrase [Limnoglobus roseus]
MSQPPPKLFDQLRHALRVRHSAIRTDDADHDGCRRFVHSTTVEPADLAEGTWHRRS